MSEEYNNTEQNRVLEEQLPREHYVDTMSDAEKDMLGEVGNICMGTSATTMYQLLGKRVEITTPKVSLDYTVNHLEQYDRPFLVARAEYTEGIDAYSMFIIKKKDALIITDLMMGGDGQVDVNGEIDDLAFSSISEMMNQMVGSSSTSLAEILGKVINMAVPTVKMVGLESESIEEIDPDEVTVKISFTMEIKDLMTTDIMQILPMKVSNEIVDKLLYKITDQDPEQQEGNTASASEPSDTMDESLVTIIEPSDMIFEPSDTMAKQEDMVFEPSVTIVQPSDEIGEQEDMFFEHSDTIVEAKAKVHEPIYQSFDSEPAPHIEKKASIDSWENMDIVMEMPLEVGVELGSCKKSIRDILGINIGSILVLDKIIGEMVEVRANGKLFATGEVVVIEDSYGIRLTEIIKDNEERLRG